VYSVTQGIGKSAFFRFLMLIFSKELCCFHSNLDKYDCQFDIQLNSKLIHWVDDLHGATKSQTRKLFPRVTEEYHTYEAKGEKQIEFNEYSEVWVSGNDKAGSLYVSSEDRRIVIYEANKTLKGDKQFWNALYDEFNNLEIAKAWYEFMKKRNIAHFHPDDVHEASQHLKSDSILESQSKSHIFVERFFSTNNWHTMFIHKLCIHPEEWYSQMSVIKRERQPRKGETCIRLTQDWLYGVYVPWMKKFFPSSKILNMNTFLVKLQDVGAVVQDKKQRLHNTTRRVVDLYFLAFQEAYREKYKCSFVTEWTTEGEDGFKTVCLEIKENISVE
jgi:hypothetical protein